MKVRFFDLKTKSWPEGYEVYVHPKQEKLDMHYHDYYEFFLTETDKITHIVNGKEVILPAGSLVFVRPEDRHKLVYPDGDFEYINFNFSAEIFTKLMDFLNNEKLKMNLLSPVLSPYVVLNEIESKSLNNKVRYILLLHDTSSEDCDMYMRRTLLDVFITYFAGYQLEGNDDMPQWLQYTLRQIKKPENFEQGVPRMVEISGKSLNQLERSLKKYTGNRPSAYINQLRIQYAASMLIHSDLTVLDIVMECGFQSVAHFYKLFSSMMGMKPREYREKNRKYYK